MELPVNPTAPLSPRGLHVPQPFPVDETPLQLSFFLASWIPQKSWFQALSLLRLTQAKPLTPVECGDDLLTSSVLSQASLSLKTFSIYI